VVTVTSTVPETVLPAAGELTATENTPFFRMLLGVSGELLSVHAAAVSERTAVAMRKSDVDRRQSCCPRTTLA
jgi:hypothetical protein